MMARSSGVSPPSPPRRHHHHRRRRSPSASQTRPRRSARLAARAQRSVADGPSPAAQDSPLDPAQQFGLAGLTVLPILGIEDIATTVGRHAEKRRSRLIQGTLTQEALIYCNATTLHLDAVRPADQDGIYPGRITFFGDESGAFSSLGCRSRFMRLLISACTRKFL
ncbi:hypothetical protein OQA88_9297 [Cercophora sp. LCS_1]